MDSHTSVLHPDGKLAPSSVPGKVRRALSPYRIIGRVRQWQYALSSRFRPNLAGGAVKTIDRVLNGSGVGIEWGAGRSTPWLAEKLGTLLSVEHDPLWQSWVNRRLPGDADARCVLRKLGNERPARCDYVQAADEFEDASLDFCLIDGRMRAECGLAVLPKVRHGGLIVLDDAQRYLELADGPGRVEARSEEWHGFARRVRGWPCLWERSMLRDTAIWVKLV